MLLVVDTSLFALEQLNIKNRKYHKNNLVLVII